MKTLLWDFDGTLAYRDGLWAQTLCDVLSNNGIDTISMEEVRPFTNIGFPWHSPDTPHRSAFGGKSWWDHICGYVAEIYQHVGLSPTEARRLAGQFRQEYLREDRWHVFGDTIDTLSFFNERGYRSVIASNHVPELEDLTEVLGIREHVSSVYTSARIGYEKPSRHFFRHILGDLQVGPSRCVMIGDSYAADIGGALRVGIPAILVRAANEKGYPHYAVGLATAHELIQQRFDQRFDQRV